MKISKSDERSFSDSNFSFFNGLTNRDMRKTKNVLTILTTIAIIFFLLFIIGISITKHAGFAYALLPVYFVSGPIAISIIDYKKIQEIIQLHKKQDNDRLVEIYRKGNQPRPLVILALADLGDKRIFDKLQYYYIHLKLIEENPNMSSIGKLSGKFLLDIEKAIIYTIVRYGWEFSTNIASDVKIISREGIPVTKVYFVKEITNKNKCMISNLPLDYKVDEIIACPSCGSMANKELLQTWLEKNKICPVCRDRITIADCPFVMVKEK